MTGWVLSYHPCIFIFQESLWFGLDPPPVTCSKMLTPTQRLTVIPEAGQTQAVLGNLSCSHYSSECSESQPGLFQCLSLWHFTRSADKNGNDIMALSMCLCCGQVWWWIIVWGGGTMLWNIAGCWNSNSQMRLLFWIMSVKKTQTSDCYRHQDLSICLSQRTLLPQMEAHE